MYIVYYFWQFSVGYDSHKELIKTCPVYQKMVYLQELEREVEGGK